ncbi:MAG TPA: LysE family translocator [Pseudonocardiaceae bacterium]|nr:LysE family translocator [Pseudonocardiaceae bacterium]
MPVNPAFLAGFLALSALLSVIPGPSVVLETGRAITAGRSSAMWIVLGNAVGGLVLLGLVLAGLGAIVGASAELFLVVKILGALYLLWLGVRSLLAARSGSTEEFATVGGAGVASRRQLVRQGFLVGVGNPKTIVSLMAILPQFVDHARGDATLQMLLIGLAGGLAQVLIETVWVHAAAGLRSWFLRRPRRIKAVKATGGLAMIGLAGKLAFQH